MKNASSVMLAVGAGYLLGRNHKLRWAIMLAVATGTGAFGGLTGQLIKRGGKLVGSSDALGGLSPEVGKLADAVRGDLADAGKAAAMAAISSKIDSLTDTLHDRAELVRNPAQAAADVAEGAGTAGEQAEEIGKQASAKVPMQGGERPEPERPEPERPEPERRRRPPERGERPRRPARSADRSGGDGQPAERGDRNAVRSGSGRPDRSERRPAVVRRGER